METSDLADAAVGSGLKGANKPLSSCLRRAVARNDVLAEL